MSSQSAHTLDGMQFKEKVELPKIEKKNNPNIQKLAKKGDLVVPVKKALGTE